MDDRELLESMPLTLPPHFCGVGNWTFWALCMLGKCPISLATILRPFHTRTNCRDIRKISYCKLQLMAFFKRTRDIFFSKIKLKYGLSKYGNKNICLAFENLTNRDRISTKAYWPLLKVQFLREKKYVMRGRKPSSKIGTTILRLHHINCARGNP